MKVIYMNNFKRISQHSLNIDINFIIFNFIIIINFNKIIKVFF